MVKPFKTALFGSKFGRFGWEPSSARFRDNFTNDLVNVLIDHIIASPKFVVNGATPTQVWNPFQLEQAKSMKSELMEASDHFPVTFDFQ